MAADGELPLFGLAVDQGLQRVPGGLQRVAARQFQAAVERVEVIHVVGEQDVFLGREVAEERTAVQPRGPRDVVDRRGIEAAFLEQVEGRGGQRANDVSAAPGSAAATSRCAGRRLPRRQAVWRPGRGALRGAGSRYGSSLRHESLSDSISYIECHGRRRSPMRRPGIDAELVAPLAEIKALLRH